MRFKPGQVPWNKGLKGGAAPSGAFKKGMTPWNKGKKTGYIPWNKGLKLGSDWAWNNGIKGAQKAWNKGKQMDDDWAWNKGLKGINIGKSNPFYKNGLYSKYDQNPNKKIILNARQKDGRFNRGFKPRAKIEASVIQRVYEGNIKKYGTLTCYLCDKQIAFGKDHLEHKVPLFRGGTNLYENLAVACQKCNLSKHVKTEEEYRKRKELCSGKA